MPRGYAKKPVRSSTRKRTPTGAATTSSSTSGTNDATMTRPNLRSKRTVATAAQTETPATKRRRTQTSTSGAGSGGAQNQDTTNGQQVQGSTLTGTDISAIVAEVLRQTSGPNSKEPRDREPEGQGRGSSGASSGQYGF